MNNNTKISVRVSPAYLKWAKMLALRQDMSVAELVTLALVEYARKIGIDAPAGRG